MTQEVVAEKNLVGKQLLDKGKQLVLAKFGSPQVSQLDSVHQTNYHLYPKPLATYEDVAVDPKLFMQTLENLHLMMGTKFMVPIVAGKELDLHKLFVEVTERGGMEKVIRDKKWRDVVASFNFPSTATNASFVLRKYYMSLIHHYEQVHFFKSQGWNSPPAGLPQISPAPSISSEKSVGTYNENQPAARKGKSNDVIAPTGLALPTELPVAGVIDGKCEHGYLITVRVGTTVLKGILYHVPGQDAATHAPHDSLVPYNATKTRRHRRKKKLRKRDPTHPKLNRSGYNFFFAEQHARLKPLYPGKDREISRMIGDLWNKMTEAEKAVYQEKGVQDKERYKNEMEAYMKKFKIDEVISDAMPIQQCPADPELGMEGKDSRIEIDDSDDSASDGSDNSVGKKSGTDSEIEIVEC